MCQTKVCTKCKEEKQIIDFHIREKAPDGRRGVCKTCKNERNREKNREYSLRERVSTSDIKQCCTCKLEKSIDNFSKKSDAKDGLMRRCKDCVSIHHQKTKDKTLITQKEYYLNNIETIRKYKNEWVKEKRSNDILYTLITNLRSNIKSTLKSKNMIKSSRTIDILGCSIEEFRLHIEKQFLNWMTWENYGKYNGEFNYGWDLDHIIPSSSAKTKEDIYLLNHWSNFQPLCSKMNRDIKKAGIISCTNLESKITY